jgi:hypothetical protein
MLIRDKFAAACIATALAGTGVTYATLQNAYAGPERAPAAQVEKVDRPVRADADADADRYAEREKDAEQQKAYQGGGYLVIGLSTTAAIVLVVVLLLLL